MSHDNNDRSDTTFLPASLEFATLSAEAAGTGIEAAERNPAMSYLMSLRAESSRLSMGSFLNNMARMMGFQDLRSCPWGMLRRHHVQAILTMLSETAKAPATINNYLAAIKGLAYEAWMMKLIDTDSYQHIKAVKSVRGTRLPKGRALSSEEVRQLFSACEEDKASTGVRDSAILATLIGCGLRRAEIVALDLESYERREQSLRVIGKGNKERLAFLPLGAHRRIDQWVEEVRGEEPGPLFCRIRRHDLVTDSRLSSQAIYYILNMRRVQAGIAPCAPHDLRRTFASTMLANGEDLMTLKDAMGHASFNTTQKYDLRGNDRLREASKRMDIV